MYQENISKSLNTFRQIVRQKYFCFQGRSSQAEFWLYLLIYALGGSILRIIPWIGCLLSGLWLLALLLPTLGIAARRLHDRGMSSWYLLLLLIPVIGSIVLLILLIPLGKAEANAYGNAPAPVIPPLNDQKSVQIIMIIAFALAAIAAIRPYYPQHCHQSCTAPETAAPENAPPAQVTAPATPTKAVPAPAPKKQQAKKDSPNPWAIYRGLSQKTEDAVCYHRNGKFYSDPERKNCILKQDGVQVHKNGKFAYYVSGGQLYKNTVPEKKDCILSLVELKTRKGELVKAKIYPGYVKARDIEEKREDDGITIVTSYNLTADGSTIIQLKPVYTVCNGKIYRGDSMEDKDCILSYYSDLNGSRLLLTVETFAK